MEATMTTGKIKFLMTVLVCIVACCGCKSEDLQWPWEGDKAKDIEQTPLEQKKNDLLKRIDKKYEDAEAHFELGKIYQSEGMLTQAEREYNLTLNFDPVHREAQAGRVKVLTAMGNKTQAQTSTEFYINQASTSAAGSLKLAMAFQDQGLDELAMRCYRQALNLAPNSAKIHRQIGFYYLARDNKDMAKEYLTRSFQLDPYQEDVGLALGRLGVVVKVPEKKENGKKIDQAFE
jgi:tetratricopeptide (TPR) repeat protein